MTVAGLRVEYGIGRSVAYELMSKGRLPYTQLGTRRLIPRAAVVRLLAEGVHGLADASSVEAASPPAK